MAFFQSAVGVLQTLVIALGAGLEVWGGINLMEGYGQDNPGAKSQGIKQLVAGGGIILIGVLLISSVWMGAKATAIKYSMNSLTKENVQLRDEITVLGIDIEGAVSFESVATYATSNLGMVYPSKNQCFFIGEDQTVDENLVKIIREKAYGN